MNPACRGAIAIALFCSQLSAANWGAGEGFRTQAVEPQGNGKVGFTLMNPLSTGVIFTNVLQGDAYLTNSVAHNGSGLAIGDVDADGWQDIYLCTLQGNNRLYRNLGNWHFQEMAIGDAACAGQISTGAAFADVDGDGDLDLLVNGIAAGTRLFLNDGKGHWTEVKDSGLSRAGSATSLTLADIDGDGDLDLYCTHYIDVMHLFDPTTRFSIIKRDGQWTVLKVNDQPTSMPKWKDRFEALPDGKVRELPEVHGLYRNDGNGHFTAIQFDSGTYVDEAGKPIPPYRDWGLAAMFRDINGDGIPDLYVCNDNVSPDRIWINSGKGTFRPIEPMAFRHTSRSSMGIDFADIDRDGHDDIIVVDMLARTHEKRMTQLVRDIPDRAESERAEIRPQYNRNTLFMGRPDGTYSECALLAGVAASDWTWCPIFIDVDLDGYEDLLVTNGFEFDVMDQDAQNLLREPRRFTREQLKRSFQFRPHWGTANAAFRNRHDGTFEPISREWGFDQMGVSYGMALGDLDNDGDLDVVVNDLNAPASLYRNETSAPRIAVRLKGKAPNTSGIGARIQLVGASLTQSQEMICAGRYLSCDQALRVFAADPKTNNPMRLEIRWRNGEQTTLTNLEANRIYQIDQGASVSSRAPNSTAVQEPFFREVALSPEPGHTEAFFDDWSRQPLLPRRLSRLGPGVSCYDFNGDGWEDFILGTGRGGKMAIYTNDHSGGLHVLEGTPASPGDQCSLLGWSDGKGNRKLLAATSNYEMPGESQLAIYSITNLAEPKLFPAGKASIGSLALADIDGDGDLDLFIGGRFEPGQYPKPVSSLVWLNDNGDFRPSPELSKPFESVGMVSGATFADLDGDGRADLALALEWGPVRVFRNNNGHFEDVTSSWGFADRTGWWNGIAVGDFDGDGRLDLAVGNWGRNSIYELYRKNDFPSTTEALPDLNLRIYYGDWNSDGIVEIIEAGQRGESWVPIRNRLALTPGFPDLATEFPTHEAFAKSDVQKLLGANYDKAKILEANEFQSGVYLNRGSRFEWRPLPREAQFAPVFAINVADFDGDGIEDLFLSQNFFGGTSDLSRDDSGRGLWLRGKGDGTFSAMDGTITGIEIYGEQRGAALADFNHDGRIDLAVSQNSGPAKIYTNLRAKPGLRVLLRGTATNPDTIGAQIRLKYASGRFGPVRVIQAGSGYWSQNASAQLLGFTEKPPALWIRWPNGSEQTLPLAEGQSEVTVTFKGNPP
jgi:hypothetical protein